MEVGLDKEFVEEVGLARPILPADRHDPELSVSEALEELFRIFVQLEFAQFGDELDEGDGDGILVIGVLGSLAFL